MFAPTKPVHQANQCLDRQLRFTELVDPQLDPEKLQQFDFMVQATKESGHGIASTGGERYPEGTIQMQYPFFKEQGLDLGKFFPGTLNVSIAPRVSLITSPAYHFREINWYEHRGKTEDFLFCDVAIRVGTGYVLGYIYTPDPATKVRHIDNPTQLQILSPFIPDLYPNQTLNLLLNSKQIQLV